MTDDLSLVMREGLPKTSIFFLRAPDSCHFSLHEEMMTNVNFDFVFFGRFSLSGKPDKVFLQGNSIRSLRWDRAANGNLTVLVKNFILLSSHSHPE